MKKILNVGLYTANEVADMLGVTERTVRTYIKSGALQAQKIGGEWAVSEDNVKAFLHGPKPAAAVDIIGTGGQPAPGFNFR